MKKRHTHSLKQKLDYCRIRDAGTIDKKTASELFMCLYQWESSDLESIDPDVTLTTKEIRARFM
jgi:hypothetical protein